MNITTASLLAAALALSCLSGEASARPRHHAAAVTVDEQGDIDSIPLTVNRRSWLDPGPVAPVGRGQAYVTANTQFNRTPDRIIDPDKFGNSEFQGQPYIPGRSQPTVEFSTLPNGRVDVANELLPQNFYFNPAPSRPAPDYQPSFSLEEP